MKGLVAAVVVGLVVAGCTQELDTTTTTSAAPPSTSTSVEPPDPVDTTTSTTQLLDGGHLVKVDPVTLEPLHGYEPIPVATNSWRVASPDGTVLAAFDWIESLEEARLRIIDVASWTTLGSYQIGDHWYYDLSNEGEIYTVDPGGRLLRFDVSGNQTVLDRWQVGWLWNGTHELADGRIGALGTGPSGDDDVDGSYDVLIYDPNTGETTTIPVGPLDRTIEDSGVFVDGVEVEGSDRPGVVWGRDRVYIVYVDGPEVIEVNLSDGQVTNHDLAEISWLTRLAAFWMPAATAKGPSIGTYTSAALSDDGRFLFVSGNRLDVKESEDSDAVAEVTRPQGVYIVDTESWTVRQHIDIPVGFINGHYHPRWIVGIGESGLHLFDRDDPGTFEKVEVEQPGTLSIENFSYDEGYLYLTRGARLEVLDLITGELLGDRLMGSADSIVGQGVLEDLEVRDEGT